MVRFPDDSAMAYRRTDSESPDTKRILEQINRVNINLGYIKPKPQPQLRYPSGGGYNIGSVYSSGAYNGNNNNHGGGSGGYGDSANSGSHSHFFGPDASFQSQYQGNSNNYVLSIRHIGGSDGSPNHPTPRKIEPSHLVLVPDMIDLQTFVYPAHLLKSISLLGALKAFEPELIKSTANGTRSRVAPNSVIADHTQQILSALQQKATNASSGDLNDNLTDKINIILVTLKQKDDDSYTGHARASRSKKSAKTSKQQRQSKLKPKTIYTRPRPRPIAPSPSNIGSLLSKAPVTESAVRQGTPITVNKGPLAALFDRPNEVVEAIKEGGVIIQRLRVRNGGIAIAGPNGIATAGSGGTAIVGPGGTAITHPKGLSIAGPGARVISVPEDTDLRQLALNTNPGEVPENGTVVAHGPVIHYNHPVPVVERLK